MRVFFIFFKTQLTNKRQWFFSQEMKVQAYLCNADLYNVDLIEY